MSRFVSYLRRGPARGVWLLLLAVGLAGGCGHKGGGGTPPPAKPKADASKAKTVASATHGPSEYASVFEDLPYQKGKDPFFPLSTRLKPAQAVTPSGGLPVHVEPSLVLHAIIGTSKHAEAVINNAILEVGEDPASVRVPNGPPVVLKCLEIGADYVVIQVTGEASPRKLTIQRKKN